TAPRCCLLNEVRPLGALAKIDTPLRGLGPPGGRERLRSHCESACSISWIVCIALRLCSCSICSRHENPSARTTDPGLLNLRAGPSSRSAIAAEISNLPASYPKLPANPQHPGTTVTRAPAERRTSASFDQPIVARV